MRGGGEGGERRCQILRLPLLCLRLRHGRGKSCARGRGPELTRKSFILTLAALFSHWQSERGKGKEDGKRGKRGKKGKHHSGFCFYSNHPVRAYRRARRLRLERPSRGEEKKVDPPPMPWGLYLIRNGYMHRFLNRKPEKGGGNFSTLTVNGLNRQLTVSS